MNKNIFGFSFFEILAVIILITISAFTALPQFFSFESDARKVALESLVGTLKSTNNMVYQKSIKQYPSLSSLDEQSCLADSYDCIDSGVYRDVTLYEGTLVKTRNGMLTANIENLLKVFEVNGCKVANFISGRCDAEWVYHLDTNKSGNKILIYPSEYVRSKGKSFIPSKTNNLCLIEYRNDQVRGSDGKSGVKYGKWFSDC